jgi:hypothetical protein
MTFIEILNWYLIIDLVCALIIFSWFLTVKQYPDLIDILLILTTAPGLVLFSIIYIIFLKGDE